MMTMMIYSKDDDDDDGGDDDDNDDNDDACFEAELLELVEGQIVKERDCAISDHLPN